VRVLIKGGLVFDPSENLKEKLDILIEDGRIREIGKGLSQVGAQVIDASGLHVFPGFIDLHAHLREPGEEYKEDLTSGALSALHGGFTTVCAMPNTKPPLDSPELISSLIEKAKALGLARILPVGTVTKGRESKVLSEMFIMAKRGAVAFSDDGDWVRDSGVMRRALEYSKIVRRPIVTHAEDKTLSRKGSMHEGKVSYSLGIRGIPEECETVALFRDISLLRLTGGRLHVAHLSSKKSIALIREAKAEGLWITCEVTPHHLLFTDEDLRTFDTNLKVNPPLRTEEDRRALVSALKEGIIDAIATDHAPHASFEKEAEFETAPFGMIGLQTAFSSLYTTLVEGGELDLETLILKLTSHPAKVLGLKDLGSIKVGYRADLSIFDLESSWVVNKGTLKSRSQNTPFLGKRLKGVLKFSIVDGRVKKLEEKGE
jgi:dihydroorotase